MGIVKLNGSRLCLLTVVNKANGLHSNLARPYDGLQVVYKYYLSGFENFG